METTQSHERSIVKLLSNKQNGKLTTGGLKHTQNGNIFQLALLTLAAVRANKSAKRYDLVTEANECEKFDDLVIDYDDHITFLQAKHSEKNGCFSRNDFMHEDGDASLAKYFDSWNKLVKKIRHTDEVKPKETKFIFFSNKKLNEMDEFIEEIQVENDEFAFLNCPSYRFKRGEKRKDFIEAIHQHSETIVPDKLNQLKVDDLVLEKFESEIEHATNIVTTKLKELYLSKNKIKIDLKNIKKSKLKNKQNIATRKYVVLAIIQLASDNKQFASVLNKYSKNSIWDKVSSRFETKSRKDALIFLIKLQHPADTTLINQFLDEFIIKTSQPNVDEILKLVRQELAEQVSIGVQETYTALMQFMLEFFRNSKNCILSSDKFNQWKEQQNADSQRYFFLIYTKIFKEEFHDYKSDLKEFINIELMEFLTEKEQKLHIIIGNNAKPLVYSTIIQMEKTQNLKIDNWIYIEFNDRIVQDIVEILQSNETKFLVINCHNIDEFSDQQSLKIDNLIKKQGNVKVILLIKKGVVIPNSLLELKSHKNILELLSHEQLQSLFKKHENNFITLGGKEYKIKDIIDQRLGSIYQILKNIQYFPHITAHSHEKELDVKSEMPYGIYIENEMLFGEGYYDLSIIFRRNTRYYIIEGVNYNVLLDELDVLFQENQMRFAEIKNLESDIEKWEKTEFILLKNPEIYSSLNFSNNGCTKTFIFTCKPVGFNEKGYILLKSVKGFSTARLKVAENPENIYLPFAQGIDYSCRGTQKDFMKDICINNHLSILLGPAGYGKSSFCTNIVDKHKFSKNMSLPIWIINIPLRSLQFDDKGQPNFNPFLNMHHNWEKEAFEADMRIKGSVLLIFDSFDEIKDAKTISLINDFLQEKPIEISCLLTTRPYATNKLFLPLKHQQSLAIYKLTEYTAKQQKEYITHYMRAVLKEYKTSEKVFNAFVKKMTHFLTEKHNNHTSKILGIPLESFLFCELLRPHILKYIANNNNQVPEICNINLGDIDISNSSNLYQEFIRSKSILYWEKHLGVKSENMLDKNIIFNLMGAYNEIMEMYALWQSFSINEDINNYTKTNSFDVSTLKTLEDTGLVKVYEDKDSVKLNFSHETYQEFYSAIAIIRGFVSESGNFFDLVEDLVFRNCYDPKFHFIFSMAAQISLVGSQMIPGYNKEKNMLTYWTALGNNFDIIGSGAVRVLKYCLAEFIDSETLPEKKIKKQFKKQVEFLLHKIEGNPLEKYIKYVLSGKEQNQSQLEKEGTLLNAGLINEDENELSINLNTIDKHFVDKNNISCKFSSIAREFRYLQQNKILDKSKVELLEENAEKHKGNFDYWALNEGIEAIGYTGSLFSKPLANFLIERAAMWPNNRKAAISALKEIYKSLKDDNGYVNAKDDNGFVNAKQNCFYVLQMIVLSAEYDNEIHNLLHQVNEEFINYLVNELSSDWICLNNDNSFIENPLIKEKKFQIIKTILFAAEKLQYAVTYEDNCIFLNKNCRIPIDFGKRKLNDNFAEEISKLIDKMNFLDIYWPGSWSNSFFLNEFDQSRIKFKHRIENINLNNNKEFDILFHESGKHKPYVCILYAHLFTNKVLNQHHVEELVKVSKDPPNGALFWDHDGGIKAIGYTGQFFNMELAQHLCKVRFWPPSSKENNEYQAVSSLKQLYNILSGSNVEHDKDYHRAVEAYNYCRKNRFEGYKLLEIQPCFGKRKQTFL